MLSKLMLSYWWVLLLRGVLAILFGIAAYAWPGMTLVTLLTLFGAFAVVNEIFNVFHAFSGRKEDERWWVLLLEGLRHRHRCHYLPGARGHRNGPDLHRLLGHGHRGSAHHPRRTPAQGDRRGVVDGPGRCGDRLRRAHGGAAGGGGARRPLARCYLGDRGRSLPGHLLLQGQGARREARRDQAEALGQSLVLLCHKSALLRFFGRDVEHRPSRAISWKLSRSVGRDRVRHVPLRAQDCRAGCNPAGRAGTWRLMKFFLAPTGLSAMRRSVIRNP